ncbi:MULTISPECIES: PucR family transcriptional regulator [unclassified Paenibacillus]|uniref:PucR family transcriptional regulator n=1 Tax=unclassified Paenibacillus TaxID=185978 RepID=UPI0015E852D0|nr:PucR family transcriptional regulator [Paenibacillus sp. tmac-D7]
MILADLLKIPCLSTSRVIAGEEGLNRIVYSVNMMDAPDIIDFLKPQELLLTTAYVIKDRPEALESLVSNMANVGCAGLMIKTKRFLPAIPIRVVEVANKLNFPIIELPLDFSLGEIMNQSLSYILEKSADELRYALESHRHFTSIVLEGKSIPEIVQELSKLLDSPTLLLNHKLELISSSRHFQSAPYMALLPVIQHALTALPATRSTQSLSLVADADSPCRNVAVHPIQTYQPQGFLISFIDNPPTNKHPFMAMEQAANVISFEMLKQQAVKERSRRYKNEFFSDLVEGFVTSEQEVIHRGKRYGLNEHSTSLCIAAKKDAPAESNGINPASLEDSRFTEREELYQLIKKGFTDHGTPFVIFTKNDLFVVILSYNPNEPYLQETEMELAELLKKIADEIYKRTQIAVSFGVGNPVQKLLDISVTYKEAFDALQTGYLSKKRMFVQFNHIKELADLLRMVPIGELKKFYLDTFQDLKGLEEKERKELMRTLMVFYENHCQIAETAKQLFVHRNTVIYRLDKCEQLTGRSLRTPSDSLRFRVAYLIEPLLH